MAFEIKNNFSAYKADFKKDTGLDVTKETMGLYLKYITARSTDYSFQVLHGLTHQLLNKIDFLPDQIRLRIAEMITDHPTIKQLLKNKT